MATLFAIGETVWVYSSVTDACIRAVIEGVPDKTQHPTDLPRAYAIRLGQRVTVVDAWRVRKYKE